MNTQNCVKTSVSGAQGILTVNSLAQQAINRTDLSLQLCQKYNFTDPAGNSQLSTCSTALRKLETQGLFTAPWPMQTRVYSRLYLPEPIPSPSCVPSGDNIELVLVSGSNDPSLQLAYNTLVRDECLPEVRLGLIGRQLEYLVKDKSTGEWIGVVGFDSPKLNSGARDSAIGWNINEKKANLQYVINLRHLIIREGCEDLFHEILEMVIATMKKDFKDKYGYTPMLLETEVNSENYSLILNFNKEKWILVSSERLLRNAILNKIPNKQKKDSHKRDKAIFLYPLDQNYQEKIAIATYEKKIELEEYLKSEDWAQKEISFANFDKRSQKRLQEILTDKAESPSGTFLESFNGRRASVKGFYRLMESQNAKINFFSILEPHFDKTAERGSDHNFLLCMSDGSDLNFSHLPNCKGLGLIGTNKQVPGLHLHASIFYTPDGIDLGISHATCGDIIHRDSENPINTSSLNLEDKNNYVWAEHIVAVSVSAMKNPNTTILFVADRGADDFSLFEVVEKCSNLEILVRSQYNRVIVGSDYKLHDELKKQSVKGTVYLEIEVKHKHKSGKSYRGIYNRRKNGNAPKKMEKSIFVKQERLFNVTYLNVEIQPQGYRKGSKPFKVTAIRAWEANPIKRLGLKEWILLTTHPVNSVEDAIQCVKWYRQRWQIEEFFRLLKTGCHVEDVYFDNAERILRSIAVNLIVAWRLSFIFSFMRANSSINADPSLLLNERQLNILRGVAIENKYEQPTNLRQAIFLIGILGGYYPNKSYPYPGQISINDGLEELYCFERLLKYSELGKSYENEYVNSA